MCLILVSHTTIYVSDTSQARRYNASLVGYQHAAVSTATSLSFLNFGQSAIFSVADATSMLLAKPREDC